jgi:hypothetical protein
VLRAFAIELLNIAGDTSVDQDATTSSLRYRT